MGKAEQSAQARVSRLRMHTLSLGRGSCCSSAECLPPTPPPPLPHHNHDSDDKPPAQPKQRGEQHPPCIRELACEAVHVGRVRRCPLFNVDNPREPGPRGPCLGQSLQLPPPPCRACDPPQAPQGGSVLHVHGVGAQHRNHPGVERAPQALANVLRADTTEQLACRAAARKRRGLGVRFATPSQHRSQQ